MLLGWSKPLSEFIRELGRKTRPVQEKKMAPMRL